jgi:hypothetical protein
LTTDNLIHNRDPQFTAEFLQMIGDARVESAKLPPRSPNLNGYAERFVRSIRESRLGRLIFFGGRHCGLPFNFIAHYHGDAITRA